MLLLHLQSAQETEGGVSATEKVGFHIDILYIYIKIGVRHADTYEHKGEQGDPPDWTHTHQAELTNFYHQPDAAQVHQKKTRGLWMRSRRK